MRTFSYKAQRATEGREEGVGVRSARTGNEDHDLDPERSRSGAKRSGAIPDGSREVLCGLARSGAERRAAKNEPFYP